MESTESLNPLAQVVDDAVVTPENRAAAFEVLSLEDLEKQYHDAAGRGGFEDHASFEDAWAIADVYIRALELEITKLRKPQVHVLCNPHRDAPVSGDEIREQLAIASENAKRIA